MIAFSLDIEKDLALELNGAEGAEHNQIHAIGSRGAAHALVSSSSIRLHLEARDELNELIRRGFGIGEMSEQAAKTIRLGIDALHQSSRWHPALQQLLLQQEQSSQTAPQGQADAEHNRGNRERPRALRSLLAPRYRQILSGAQHRSQAFRIVRS